MRSSQSGARKSGVAGWFENHPKLRKMGEIAVTDPDAQFMYSCLTDLADGRVGILFEDHESRWGVGDDCFYTMRYKTYDLSQIMKPEFDG